MTDADVLKSFDDVAEHYKRMAFLLHDSGDPLKAFRCSLYRSVVNQYKLSYQKGSRGRFFLFMTSTLPWQAPRGCRFPYEHVDTFRSLRCRNAEGSCA